MPNSQSHCRLAADELSAFACACFCRAGMETDDARIAADALVRADLRGVDTHGVNRLAGYVRALLAGKMNPRPAISIVREEAAALLVDGDRGLGHVVSTHAMQLCIQRARRS